MRRARSQSPSDFDAVDVFLVEDEDDADEFLRVLRQLALEAIALRATSPGDPHVEVVTEVPPPAAPPGGVLRRLLRRLLR